MLPQNRTVCTRSSLVDYLLKLAAFGTKVYSLNQENHVGALTISGRIQISPPVTLNPIQQEAGKPLARDKGRMKLRSLNKRFIAQFPGRRKASIPFGQARRDDGLRRSKCDRRFSRREEEQGECRCNCRQFRSLRCDFNNLSYWTLFNRECGFLSSMKSMVDVLIPERGAK